MTKEEIQRWLVDVEKSLGQVEISSGTVSYMKGVTHGVVMAFGAMNRSAAAIVEKSRYMEGPNDVGEGTSPQDDS